MMKLLFYLYRYPGWGGIETVTSLIINELLNRGYSIDILSHQQQYEAQDIPSGVTLFIMPDKSALDTEKNREYAKYVIKENSYDLVIYQDCYEPNEGLVIDVSNECGVPFFLFEHNTPMLLYKVKFLSQNPLKKFIQNLIYPILRMRHLNRERKRKRLLYDNCYKYVLLSSKYIPEIAKRIQIPVNDDNKFSFIPNPINFNVEVNNQKCKEILFVGRLVKEKQVKKLLEIWKRLQDKYPDWRFSIVGDGPLRLELENFAKKIKTCRVDFYGFQNPLEFYKRARLFLMASDFEGWGMTLLEAISQGCVPVAENNFSALTDIIEDGIDGIIIPEKSSIKNWVNTLGKLMDNSDFLTQMAKEGPTKLKKFSIDTIVDKWESLIVTVK